MHGFDLADSVQPADVNGDPGHAPARALYEKLGFKPLPLVRYYPRL
jgi:hypothetical protein